MIALVGWTSEAVGPHYIVARGEVTLPPEMSQEESQMHTPRVLSHHLLRFNPLDEKNRDPTPLTPIDFEDDRREDRSMQLTLALILRTYTMSVTSVKPVLVTFWLAVNVGAWWLVIGGKRLGF